MKIKTVLSVCVITISLFTTSCSTLTGIFGKHSVTEDTAKNKIENVQKAQVKNDKVKMEQVAVLASGTDYALNKVTNKEPSVSVAQDINKRVVSLAGTPNLNAEKEMWKTVDQLTSELAKEREKGVKNLEKKDKEISSLQTESKTLEASKDAEISKYIKLANDTALKADGYKSSLDEMDSWFGLGAVFYGVKKLVVSGLWFIGIGGLIFLVLRFASMSNPIAASIFSVFEHMVSWVIHTISALFPKALSMAGNVSKEIYDQSSVLLKKIVDGIQNIKELEKKTGKDITLKELLAELDKSFDQQERDMVAKIKKDLGY
jgi:hypothetical protein